MSFHRIAMPVTFALSLLTGACAPAAVTMVSYGADGVSLAESGKSTTDHLASMVSKKDCAFWRMFRGEKICREREGDQDPYKVDYSQPNRQPSEDGVAYAPPLHAPAGAPATSWTAESYKTAPTAVADATPPAATPKASPPKLPKTGKAKSRARTKPVRKA